MSADLVAAAKSAVKAARDAGAATADALSVTLRETRLKVRRGEVETSQQSETRGVGVRAFRGGRTGIAYTTDVSPAGLRRAGRQAAELAAVTGEDPAAGLPAPEDRADPRAAAAGIEDPEFESVTPDRGLEMARACEAAAFAADPRVTNSEGATFRACRVAQALAASDGFHAQFRGTRFALAVGVVAEESGGVLQRDGWHTAATSLGRLEPPESVGREAARRCLRRLGWRKVATCQVPVVLSPEVAASFAAEVAAACCGSALYRGASFLADSLGEEAASPAFTLVDDPTLPGALGSRPFDAEGVRQARRAVFEKGRLRGFLFDTYSLRRLRAEAPARAAGGVPGNATRGLGGSTGVGFSNLLVEPGPQTAEAVIAGAGEGFYVTHTMGAGVNTTTGDYSQGAEGLWIRSGRLDHAVQEVTIAGRLREMLLGVEAVADDLVLRDAVAAPTLRIGRMTVSGV